jgi:hypothetical protein
MEKINLNQTLTNIPTLEFETSKGLIDLHNDYVCKDILLFDNTLKLLFQKDEPTIDYVPKSMINEISLIFEHCIFDNLQQTSESIKNNIGLSLDNLSKSNLNNGRCFYVLSFTDGEEYEIDCQESFLHLI